MQSPIYSSFLTLQEMEKNENQLPSAYPINGRATDFVSVGTGNEPILLISSSGGGAIRAPFHLRHIKVEYFVPYKIRYESLLIEDRFTVISLRNGYQELYEPFCLAMDVLLSQLPEKPDADKITSLVTSLAEMLASVVQPARQTVSGLWAELWLISKAFDSKSAVEAWALDQYDKFDFSFPSHFVEVKATTNNDRSHELSYEQIRSSENNIVIASIKLQQTSRGLSVGDLIGQIQEKLPNSLHGKILRNIFSRLGSDIEEANEIRYDDVYAETNLLIINASQLPSVHIPSDSGISAVRFRLDFDHHLIASSLRKCSSSFVLLPDTMSI